MMGRLRQSKYRGSEVMEKLLFRCYNVPENPAVAPKDGICAEFELRRPLIDDPFCPNCGSDRHTKMVEVIED